MTRKHHARRRTSFGSVLVFALLILYVISVLFALGWSIITSLKGRLDYATNKFGFPEEWMWSNYPTAIEHFVAKGILSTKSFYFENMLLNSLLYAGVGSLLGTICTSVMAYVSARFHFKISHIILTIVIITMSLPIVGSLPSGIQITKALHLFNTYPGMLIMQFYFIGAHFLILYEAFQQIPGDYADAARVDGANNFQIMIRVIFPMIAGAFFTVWLIKFVTLWNNYQINLDYLPDIPTLAYGLYVYTQSTDSAISSTPMQMAGCNFLIIPSLIVFLVFHKQLMGTSSEGGIKG